MKASRIWTLIILCVALALAFAPTGIALGQATDGPLFNYEVNTIRARRIEIVDETGVRIVLTVHKGQPVITFGDGHGKPVGIKVVLEGGLIGALE